MLSGLLQRAFSPAVAASSAAAADRLDAGALRLSGVDKHYGTTAALQQLSLTLGEGEVLAVTGPSGAGKSTLGRLISGLELPSAGEIALGGTPIGDWPPQSRRVAHMFESFALYPTRTVFENVASAAARAGRPRPLDRRRVPAAHRGGAGTDGDGRPARAAAVAALGRPEAARGPVPRAGAGPERVRA